MLTVVCGIRPAIPQARLNMEQGLRDRSNRLLSKIRLLSNGKYEGRDAKNRFKGAYDSKTNETSIICWLDRAMFSRH